MSCVFRMSCVYVCVLNTGNNYKIKGKQQNEKMSVCSVLEANLFFDQLGNGLNL